MDNQEPRVTEQATNKMLSEMVERARLATDAHCDGLPYEPSKEYSDAYFYQMLTRQAAPEAPALILSGEEIDTVRAAKKVMVDALISSNLRYGASGVISHHLEKLIASLAAPATQQAGAAEIVADVVLTRDAITDRLSSSVKWRDPAATTASASIDTPEFRDLINALLREYWNPEPHVAALIEHINRRAPAPSQEAAKVKEGDYSAGAKALIGSVMPCGACVTNVYEAYEAGKRAAQAAHAGAAPESKRGMVRAGWFTYEGIAWVATSSDDPRATILYREPDTAIATCAKGEMK